MISVIYTPDAIVLATLSSDTYLDADENGIVTRITINGHRHHKIFWMRYVLFFRQMQDCSYSDSLINILDDYELSKAEKIPTIRNFADDISKIIKETGIDVVCVACGYEHIAEDYMQHVYFVQKNDVRRLNLNDQGKTFYGCQFIERDNVIGRLFREIKMQNGEKWENINSLRFRCDLYSIEKSLDLAKFFINTSYYVNNINTATLDDNLSYETVVITRNKII